MARFTLQRDRHAFAGNERVGEASLCAGLDLAQGKIVAVRVMMEQSQLAGVGSLR